MYKKTIKFYIIRRRKKAKGRKPDGGKVLVLYNRPDREVGFVLCVEGKKADR